MIQFKPTTADQEIKTFLKIDGQFLNNGSIHYRNSGLKTGAEASDLIVLYNNAFYFWNWQSQYNHPYLIHQLPTVTPSVFKFQPTVSNNSVFILVSQKIIKFYSILKPSANIFEIENTILNRNIDVCISSSIFENHVAVNYKNASSN